MAHFISQTTYAELKAEIAAATEDSESFDDKTQKPDSTHTIENEKKTVKKTEKKWIPTEKIIKMWVGKKGQEHEDPELGSELSVQRMRASVTADSLMLCLRLAQEEYY